MISNILEKLFHQSSLRLCSVTSQNQSFFALVFIILLTISIVPDAKGLEPMPSPVSGQNNFEIIFQDRLVMTIPSKLVISSNNKTISLQNFHFKDNHVIPLDNETSKMLLDAIRQSGFLEIKQTDIGNERTIDGPYFSLRINLGGNENEISWNNMSSIPSGLSSLEKTLFDLEHLSEMKSPTKDQYNSTVPEFGPAMVLVFAFTIIFTITLSKISRAKFS